MNHGSCLPAAARIVTLPRGACILMRGSCVCCAGSLPGERMSAMKRKTNVDVLVVEDDDFLGRALQAKFDLEGIPVRIARDGDIALAEVRRKPPALILLDIMLP